VAGKTPRSAAGAWILGITAWFAVSLVIGLGAGSGTGKAGAPRVPGTGATLEITPDPRTGRNLNVLLVTIDTLRPDRLGCYGYPLGPSTPWRPAASASTTRWPRRRSPFPLTPAS
jgi:hypothetical protein